MKNKILILFTLLCFTSGCNDDKFLEREPSNILLDDQVWQEEDLVVLVLSNLYDRYPMYQGLENWWEFINFDEAFPAFDADYWRVRNSDFGYGDWGYDNNQYRGAFTYIRELNLFIEKAAQAEALDEAIRAQLMAEARFLRAGAYFDMVKRIGGVPLITESLEYDFGGDPSYLQKPRSPEHEVYDFVLEELEAIKDDLPVDPNLKSRATKATALALKSRAALYAGSIARYNVNTPSVTLPNDVVGIPAAQADRYFQISLDAAQEIIDGSAGNYALYQKSPDLEENFANLFVDENGNSEVIFAKDYADPSRTHLFTFENIPRSVREDNTAGGKINPTLNLVQSYELLDNNMQPLQTTDSEDNYIYYDNPEDIFANRDARLGGTIIYPGASFRGVEVDIFRGIIFEGIKKEGLALGATEEINGEQVQIVGADGPISGENWVAQSGFYIRKYLDKVSGSGSRGTGSGVWWIRFRYAEVLLNAAEAAWSLNLNNDALLYLNQVRQRAGFQTDLTTADLSLERFIHERRVEFAFEDHRIWDLKRWRLAHEIWNGEQMNLEDLNLRSQSVENSDEKNTKMFGLYPYKIYSPGDPNDGKWVFEKVELVQNNTPEYFRLGNYYSAYPTDALNRNPLLVRNPNQN